jgi:DNA polymerase III delta prime subunit
VSGQVFLTSKLVLCSDLEQGFAAFAAKEGRVLGSDPNILLVQPEETTIGIEPIRDMQGLLSMPPAGDAVRLVFLGPAEKITQPAQQALLKILEEPPERTQICLFARAKSDVLPTIISRCIVVDVREKREGESSRFLLPLSQAKSTKEKLLILASFPAQRDSARDFLLTELTAVQKLPQTETLIKLQQTTLDVLDALQSNVTPALCGDQFLL